MSMIRYSLGVRDRGNRNCEGANDEEVIGLIRALIYGNVPPTPIIVRGACAVNSIGKRSSIRVQRVSVSRLPLRTCAFTVALSQSLVERVSRHVSLYNGLLTCHHTCTCTVAVIGMSELPVIAPVVHVHVYAIFGCNFDNVDILSLFSSLSLSLSESPSLSPPPSLSLSLRLHTCTPP